MKYAVNISFDYFIDKLTLSKYYTEAGQSSLRAVVPQSKSFDRPLMRVSLSKSILVTPIFY